MTNTQTKVTYTLVVEHLTKNPDFATVLIREAFDKGVDRPYVPEVVLFNKVEDWTKFVHDCGFRMTAPATITTNYAGNTIYTFPIEVK